MLNRQQEYQKMSVVECNHWWYKTLHKLVLESLFEYIPDKDSNILDAGCGSGGLPFEESAQPQSMIGTSCRSLRPQNRQKNLPQ